MAGPLTIQRVPRGLGDLLRIFGGESPKSLAPEARATLDMMQLYGLTQWQLKTAGPSAIAEGAALTITVPSNEWWAVFSFAAAVVKTATMTACRGALQFGPDANQMATVLSQELGPFGATETGSARVALHLPYVRLLPPGSILRFELEILGTDATASCSLSASVGVLG